MRDPLSILATLHRPALLMRAARIAAQSAPIGIIHGTADEAFPVSNSEKIIAAAQHGTLKTVEGAGHSFKDHEHETALMALTHELLQ